MSDAGDALANAANIWTVGAGVLGAVATYVTLWLTKEHDAGEFEGQVKRFMTSTTSELDDLRDKHEAHVTLVRTDIGRLSERDSRTRDQLADIRASMAQRSDLAAMSTAVQTAIASLSARIDDVFGRK